MSRQQVKAENIDGRRENGSALGRRIARAIADKLRDDALAVGAPLNQLALAEEFGVSRTPIRAALKHLAATGAVDASARGFRVADPAAFAASAFQEPDAMEALIAAIAQRRHRGDLADEISEADLMRRFETSRTEVVAALRHLAGLGLVMRKPGFGWRFLTAAETPDERAAAYRFRLAIEPAALLEPGYAAAPEWLDRMRKEHLRYLHRDWRDADSVAFFEMNAAFHAGLVGFSGNRFFMQATEQQNSLRRLRNYSWRLGPERVRVSCEEHLSVIEALGDGTPLIAAERLTAHLANTAAFAAVRLSARSAEDADGA